MYIFFIILVRVTEFPAKCSVQSTKYQVPSTTLAPSVCCMRPNDIVTCKTPQSGSGSASPLHQLAPAPILIVALNSILYPSGSNCKIGKSSYHNVVLPADASKPLTGVSAQCNLIFSAIPARKDQSQSHGSTSHRHSQQRK